MFGNLLWSIYLGLLFTASIGLLIKGKYKTMQRQLDFVISIITWIGLFGYVTHIQILTPVVWKFVFICGLLWDVIINVFFIDFEEELPLAARIFGLVILAPLYYGLYHYAF